MSLRTIGVKRDHPIEKKIKKIEIEIEMILKSFISFDFATWISVKMCSYYSMANDLYTIIHGTYFTHI